MSPPIGQILSAPALSRQMSSGRGSRPPHEIQRSRAAPRTLGPIVGLRISSYFSSERTWTESSVFSPFPSSKILSCTTTRWGSPHEAGDPPKGQGRGQHERRARLSTRKGSGKKVARVSGASISQPLSCDCPVPL